MNEIIIIVINNNNNLADYTSSYRFITISSFRRTKSILFYLFDIITVIVLCAKRNINQSI